MRAEDWAPRLSACLWQAQGDNMPFNLLALHTQDAHRSPPAHTRSSRSTRIKIQHPILGQFARKYHVYESNIEPMLRFMHIRKIKATGWVKLPKGEYE